MGSSLRTRETLLYGESENRTFQEIIEAGSTLGWHSFDQSLLTRFRRGRDLGRNRAPLFHAQKQNASRPRDGEEIAHADADEPSGLKIASL